MKQLDRDGLLLCRIQGDIFEKSLTSTKSSSEVFIRRYLNSNIVKTMDSGFFLDDTLTREEVFEIIEKEYGNTEYGSVKFAQEPLYWMGYIYRYFSYTYELSSKQVYKLIKPKDLYGMYNMCRTLDCSQAIERILEIKNISLNTEETKNNALLDIIRRTGYRDGTKVILVSDFLLSNGIAYRKPYIECLKSGDKFLNVAFKGDTYLEVFFNSKSEDEINLNLKFFMDKCTNQIKRNVGIEMVKDYVKKEFKIDKIQINII